MAYERSKSTQNSFGNLIRQFQPGTKTNQETWKDLKEII